MSLRSSQVETLERVGRHGSLTPYQLSLLTGKPLRDSKERLAGLHYEGFLGAIEDSYRLTNKGREELQREGDR